VTEILRLHGLSRSFGSLKVTDDVSLGVALGEALGILGPNGAGKSTLFNLITGTLRPNAGRIYFAEREITAMAPHERCRSGIARSYQIPHPFGQMTVFENLLVGAIYASGRREAECYAGCVEVLEQTGLAAKANVLAGSLTLLERKRLELARALATRPKLLLLDEIAGGLTEHECQSLVELIRAIHAGGITIVWIEHIVHALIAVVGRLIVLDAGRLIAEGEPHAVLADPDVQDVYLGIAAE
jgi:branched-chain amino acid transport system ATP-binding protein